VVETAATIVQKDQVVQNACGGCGSGPCAWFLVTSFVDVVGFAECVEIASVTEEVRAVVCHILL